MCKYGMEIILEVEPYKTVRFSIGDCNTKEEAEEELKTWLKTKPELTSKAVNKRLISLVLE